MCDELIENIAVKCTFLYSNEVFWWLVCVKSIYTSLKAVKQPETAHFIYPCSGRGVALFVKRIRFPPLHPDQIIEW